ncbi:MAG: DUF2336 domain-containing protein [Hyphomicrobiaceae bacterium]|nr:DUF2336 domain-containing protein [Hyphomicrobiaceae bacterium]
MQSTRGCLLELQKLASSDADSNRGEILDRVTDLFFLTSDDQDEMVRGAFGDVMERIAFQLEATARERLAERLADVRYAPHDLVCRLAGDEIGVARLILEQSPCLTDPELVQLATNLGQDHLLAISHRREISALVTDVIVERGHDPVLISVAENKGANFSQESLDQLAVRAATNSDLYSLLEVRADLPGEFLIQLKQTVASRLKQEVAGIPISISGADLDAIIEAKAAQMNLVPADGSSAGADGQPRNLNITENMVAGFARTRRLTEAIQGLSLISGLPLKRVAHCLLTADLTALAVLCKGHNFKNSTFSALMQLRSASNPSPVRVVAEAMRNYELLNAETARRAIETVRKKAAAAEGT